MFYSEFLQPVNEQFLVANPFVILTTVIIEASGRMQGQAMTLVVEFVRNQMIVSFVLAAAATLAVRRTHLAQRSGKRQHED